jgi:hypothetical protein
MERVSPICLFAVAVTTLVASGLAEAQCLSLPCDSTVSSSSTALSVTNTGTGRALEGHATSGIGVIGISDNRGVVGTQGETSCAGTYAVGGCATTGDGVVGRSSDGFAGRFEGRVLARVLEITGGSDIAEPFNVAHSEVITPGMLVSIDPERPGQLRVSSKPYDRTVAGVVSGANGVTPGITLKSPETPGDGLLPVALTGRV